MFKIQQHYAIKAIRSSARTTSSSSYNVFNQPNNNNNRYMTTNHSNHETFQSEEEHLNFLESISTLPKGFRVGTSSFHFNPVELPTMDANMNMTVISLDNPSSNWAAVFTKNAFPGSPIIYGRKLLQSGKAMKGIVKINLPSSNGPMTEYIVNMMIIIIAEISTEIFNENFVSQNFFILIKISNTKTKIKDFNFKVSDME